MRRSSACIHCCPGKVSASPFEIWIYIVIHQTGVTTGLKSSLPSIRRIQQQNVRSTRLFGNPEPDLTVAQCCKEQFLAVNPVQRKVDLEQPAKC